MVSRGTDHPTAPGACSSLCSLHYQRVKSDITSHCANTITRVSLPTLWFPVSAYTMH